MGKSRRTGSDMVSVKRRGSFEWEDSRRRQTRKIN